MDEQSTEQLRPVRTIMRFDTGAPYLAALNKTIAVAIAERKARQVLLSAYLIEKAMYEKKGMYPNVDFYSASTYYLMGIPLDQYTPIFAVSRISGWTGHILEQYGHNKLIRPRAEYIGARDQKYVPIDER